MSSLIWAAQVAMVAKLEADAGVGALIGDRVYDGIAPAEAVAPYVVVGDSTEAPVRAMGGTGGDATLTAHVFSDYEGAKEGLEIVDAIDTALATPLTLSGFGAARLKREFVTTLVETDRPRPRRHFPVRYRIVSWPT